MATSSQKPRSMKRGEKYNGYLFTGYTAGVLQMARPVFGLIYGTREPAVMLREKCNRHNLEAEYRSAM